MTTYSPARLFKSIACFSELSPEAIEWLMRYVVELTFIKGQIIILEGEKCPGLFVVKSGSAKVYLDYTELTSTFVSILARRLRSLVHIVGDFHVRRIYPQLASLLYQLAE